MLAKILPLALALVGTGAGVGAGLMLRPAEAPDPVEPAPAAAVEATAVEAAPTPCGEADPYHDAAGKSAAPLEGDGKAGGGDAKTGGEDFLKLDQQFVVPVLSEGRVGAMVIMSLTLALEPGLRDGAHARAPRLYDRFLRVMLDHANTGGFDGAFTANGAMDRLEDALLQAGRAELGTGLREILVLDLNRRDV